MVHCASNLVCGVLVVMLLLLVGYAAWVGGKEAFASGRVVDDCQYGDVDALEYPNNEDADRLNRLNHENEEAFKQGVYKVLNRHMSSVNKRHCKLFMYYDKEVIHISHAMVKHGSTELDTFLSNFYTGDTRTRQLKFQVCPKNSQYDTGANNCICPMGKTCGSSTATRTDNKPSTDDNGLIEDEHPHAKGYIPYNVQRRRDESDAEHTSDELIMANDPDSPVFEVLDTDDELVGKLPKCYNDYEKAKPKKLKRGGENAFLCKDKRMCMDNRMVGVLGGFLDLEGGALVDEINRRCGNNGVPIMD